MSTGFITFFRNLIQPKYLVILLLLVIIISIICLCIFLLILLLIVGYILFQIHNFNKTGTFINVYDYDKKTKKCLTKYANYKIQGLFLLTKQCSNLSCTTLNILTFYKYKEFMSTLQPCHSQLLIVVKKGNKNAFLIIHKRPNITLTDHIKINYLQHITKIPIHSDKYTVNQMLNSVKNNMNSKYFNWNIIDNNCQHFVKEIINVLKKYDKKYIKYNIIKFDELTKNKFTTFDHYILNILSAYLIIISDNMFDFKMVTDFFFHLLI